MKNCQYVAAKNAISKGLPIAQETYDDLVSMRDHFQKKVDTLTVQGDIAQAMFFKETCFEIIGLLEKATIAT